MRFAVVLVRCRLANDRYYDLVLNRRDLLVARSHLELNVGEVLVRVLEVGVAQSHLCLAFFGTRRSRYFSSLLRLREVIRSVQIAADAHDLVTVDAVLCSVVLVRRRLTLDRYHDLSRYRRDLKITKLLGDVVVFFIHITPGDLILVLAGTDIGLRAGGLNGDLALIGRNQAYDRGFAVSEGGTVVNLFAAAGLNGDRLRRDFKLTLLGRDRVVRICTLLHGHTDRVRTAVDVLAFSAAQLIIRRAAIFGQAGNGSRQFGIITAVDLRIVVSLDRDGDRSDLLVTVGDLKLDVREVRGVLVGELILGQPHVGLAGVGAFRLSGSVELEVSFLVQLVADALDLIAADAVLSCVVLVRSRLANDRYYDLILDRQDLQTAGTDVQADAVVVVPRQIAFIKGKVIGVIAGVALGNAIVMHSGRRSVVRRLTLDSVPDLVEIRLTIAVMADKDVLFGRGLGAVGKAGLVHFAGVLVAGPAVGLDTHGDVDLRDLERAADIAHGVVVVGSSACDDGVLRRHRGNTGINTALSVRAVRIGVRVLHRSERMTVLQPLDLDLVGKRFGQRQGCSVILLAGAVDGDGDLLLVEESELKPVIRRSDSFGDLVAVASHGAAVSGADNGLVQLPALDRRTAQRKGLADLQLLHVVADAVDGIAVHIRIVDRDSRVFIAGVVERKHVLRRGSRKDQRLFDLIREELDAVQLGDCLV